MAGMIKHEDVERVRQAADLADIVGQTVQLKPSGTGEYMGLCPFHDEKTPSLAVRPGLGVWHCFGCGLGGDVFAFVERRDGVGFADAVEILADHYGITLHYENSRGGQRREGSQRSRLLQVNEETQKFFAHNLLTKEGLAARQEMGRRNFTKAQAEYFGVGYAPRGWNNLTDYLAAKGFTRKEMIDAGVARPGSNGIYDYFRGRVTWPIRDASGRTLGFGARKLYDDDTIQAKYINTPDTQLYHKERVLYGLDLARKTIIATRSIVIVEGYTDVMAMHCAGITNAVATCGTAFGFEHAKIVRRLIQDQRIDSVSGGSKVIFTFDGDAAGQKAALHAFRFDDAFLTQTFVAVAHDNLDPCDLRLTEGDVAVQHLIHQEAKPLYDFVIDTRLASYDLRYTTGQVAALQAVAPDVARIRNRAMMEAYARKIAGRLPAMTLQDVRKEVENARRSLRIPDANPYRPSSERGGWRTESPIESAADTRIAAAGNAQTIYDVMDRTYLRQLIQREVNSTRQPWLDRRYRVPDTVFESEQQLLAVVLQMPMAIDQKVWDTDLSASSFAAPVFVRVFQAINRARIGEDGTLRPLPRAGESIPQWYHRVKVEAGEQLGSVIDALCVLPIPVYLDSKNVGDRTSLGAPGGQSRGGQVRPGQDPDSAPSQMQVFPEATQEERSYAMGILMAIVDASLGEQVSSLGWQLRRETDENRKLEILKELEKLNQRRHAIAQDQFQRAYSNMG